MDAFPHASPCAFFFLLHVLVAQDSPVDDEAITSVIDHASRAGCPPDMRSFFREDARPGNYTKLVCMPVQDMELSKRVEMRKLRVPSANADQEEGTALCSGGWAALVVANTDLVIPTVRAISG